MDFLDFFAGQNDDDRRLDKVLRLYLKNAPLSEIYKLIRKGLIKVNEKKSKSDYRIKFGDKISIAAFLIENSNNEIQADKNDLKNSEYVWEKNKTSAYGDCNKNIKIDIKKITAFQNEHILILEKPYDIKVHGDENSLDVAVKKYYLENLDSPSLSFSPGPLHRLDRKTTGLIAFSMSLKGAKWFSENIQNHKIKKIYIGILQGTLSKPERWEDYISKDGDSQNISKDDNSPKLSNQTSSKSPKSYNSSFKKVDVSQNSEPNSKKAVTIATPLKHGNFCGIDITLSQFEIETGRTHQIRSQSSAHGFPLLGDTAYGGKKIHFEKDIDEKNKESHREFFLHATKLILPENDIGLPHEIISMLTDFPLGF